MEDVVEDEVKDVVGNERIIKKISEKYGKNELMIKTMLEKYIDLGYNIESFERDINNFYNNCY